MARDGVGPIHRLVSPEEFRLVYREGRRVVRDPVAVYVRRNRLPVSRVGFSVARGIGTAVARNRLRRRIREAFRHEQVHLAGGFDVVLVPRAPAAATPFTELRAVLREALTQAGVTGGPGEHS